MAFPTNRPRRLRANEPLRALVRETQLSAADLIYPLFVGPGQGVREPVTSMPGVLRLSADQLASEAKEIKDLGIPGVILFGIPESKDPEGSGAYDEDGIVQRAIRSIKDAVPDLVVIGDVCLCEYTDHGHCGVLSDGDVENDVTLPLLAETAVSQANAGADIVAPSDMMDGRVGAIRSALDAEGFEQTPILSYASKYASGFYGPFRDAVGSSDNLGKGDKKTYQMDPANSDEALHEIMLDLEEGADMVMVKPGMPYLDVGNRGKTEFGVPTMVYQVSGEYAMHMAAIERGWLDEAVITEGLVGIKRSGADGILTYFAKRVAIGLAG